jgi:hypothetical protein
MWRDGAEFRKNRSKQGCQGTVLACRSVEVSSQKLIKKGEQVGKNELLRNPERWREQRSLPGGRYYQGERHFRELVARDIIEKNMNIMARYSSAICSVYR